MPSNTPETPPAASGDIEIGIPLGRAIREARAAKKLSMRTLATAAEISQPFLSQIETGQTMPSLVTLYRIANALDLSPSALLPSLLGPDSTLVTRHDGGHWTPIAEVENAAETRIISSANARATTVQEYRVSEGQYMGDWFESDGDLTVHVIEGEITVEIAGRGSWDLDAGDSISHPGALRNRWAARGPGPIRIILVYAVAP